MRFKGVLRRKCDALFPVQTTHLCFDKQKTTYHSKENVILKAGGSERRKLIRYLEKLMTLYKNNFRTWPNLILNQFFHTCLNG